MKLYYKRSNMFQCFCAIFRELQYCVCQSYEILKLYKTVDRCIVKSMLLMKCYCGCICTRRTKTLLLNCICSHCHILSTAQIL
jgi:hypothetical protein